MMMMMMMMMMMIMMIMMIMMMMTTSTTTKMATTMMITNSLVACVWCADVQTWSRENVQQWLGWTTRNYNLQDVDVSKFRDVDGDVLCGMTHEDLAALVNPYNANVLYQYLNHLRRKYAGQSE
jgi:hypothetical protein